MNTKIVYVLVSRKNDYYLEQTLISIYSCRMHNKDAEIVVVLDWDTYKHLKGKRSEIKRYVSCLIPVDIPLEYNNMQRSRYLKTNLRKIISGDFLYVDSDTVVADSLLEIDNLNEPLAAVYDSNRNSLISDSSYISDTYINNSTNELGWPSVLGYPNYNGGVFLVRDCEISYKFFDRWNELWKESVSKGMNIDMPSLCRANIELGCCIKELDGIWNCQIQRMGAPLLPKAKIIHCFTGRHVSLYELCSDRILIKVKDLGYIDDETKVLIQNARTAFVQETATVSLGDSKLLKSPLFKLNLISPFMFRLLNKLAGLIINIHYL